ncbi:MAG: efflux RND transporter periplasmic adaptor subunit [Cytophagales bacterium]|nr:MAG: efflux RND transporter periplasmic adaptor subunit [Cytophagales bacterium]
MIKSIIITGFIGFIITIQFSCQEGNSQKDGQANLVLPVTTLSTHKTELHRFYVGTVDAVQNVEIRARVQGYLEKIFVDEGKEVQKGQLLFAISDQEYDAEVDRSKAALKTALAESKRSELELDRIRILVEKGVVSKTELQVAQANFEAINAGIARAESALNHAKTRLSYTLIRAPFSGIINRIPFKVGSLISEGTLMTSVSDLQYVYAYFNVSESDYLEYIKNQIENPEDVNKSVKLLLADGSYYPEIGTIETMDGEFKETTGSIAFRAKFKNRNNMLKHGSSGTIKLTNHLNNALIVPQKSTFEIQDKSYVFVLDNNNHVYARSFVPKTRYSDFYIVQSGLNKGDKVVYEGIQKLKEGMQINPQFMTIDSLKSVSSIGK